MHYLLLGEDVCLIVCEPTLVELVGLLESLATLCVKDSPADLVTLAFNTLQPNTSSSGILSEVELHRILLMPYLKY
jgi:hypothetical protein